MVELLLGVLAVAAVVETVAVVVGVLLVLVAGVALELSPLLVGLAVVLGPLPSALALPSTGGAVLLSLAEGAGLRKSVTYQPEPLS